MSDFRPSPFSTQPPDLFTDAEQIEYTLASTSQRFLNYIIDNLVMQLVISWVMTYVAINVITAISPDTAYTLFVKSPKLVAGLLIGSLNYVLYYTVSEKVFSGLTLGKLVTGTKAIREDGDELTFWDALFRSLCRLVPFEAFSILFGYGPWHDEWTKTKVIQTR